MGKYAGLFCPDVCRKNCRECKRYSNLLNLKCCIGAFVDNEISWQRKVGVTALAVLSCPATQPAKIEMQKVIEKKYGTVAALNKAWKSNYSDWNDFLACTDFEPKMENAKDDLLAFENYFGALL